MKRVKKFLSLILYPRVSILVVCDILAALLLVYTFAYSGEDGFAAYFSYVFSAYALVVSCLNFVPAVKRMKGAVIQAAGKSRHVNRYMTDAAFKMQVSLSVSAGLNILYAALKFISGMYYRSAWLITLAAYYFLLLMMRFLLLRHIVKGENNAAMEWKRCRACGIFLIMMNLVLAGMVVLVIRRGEGFVYAGYLIYAMAAYDFYTITMAVIHLIRSRKQGSPIFTAARVINVAAGLIAILSLETAMITQFGSDSGEEFRLTMIAATGGGISVIMHVMAVTMIVRATRGLKELRAYDSER